MDDIEDIVNAKNANSLEDNNRILHSQVAPNARSLREKESEGLQKVYVKTWGCSHNNSDGEYMAGLLASHGYNMILEDSKKETADLWVLNSCTVKNPSEESFLNAVRDARRSGKKIVVAGCVPQGEKKHKELSELSVVGVQQIDRVVEVVEETLKGNSVRLLGKKNVKGAPGPALILPKIRKNALIEIVPINQGCLNQCTYCKTKHSRGDLQSYRLEDIVDRIASVIREGVREIWLSSEDTGAYGRDIGTSLPELLEKIVQVLPEQGVMLRVGMTNPPYILNHLESIAKILNNPKVYAFLHVPIQSASNKVLENMKRKYTREEFCRVVDFLRSNVPGITIATDVICGFPEETDDDFKETVDLVEKYRFPALHISQFYPRRGTPAARMKRIPTHIVKERSREISKLFNSYQTLDDKVGKTFRVLCTEVATDKKHYVAHNKFFDQVLVPMDPSLMGKTFEVKITQASKFYLMGEIVREPVELSLNDLPVVDFKKESPEKDVSKGENDKMLLFLSLCIIILSIILWFIGL